MLGQPKHDPVFNDFLQFFPRALQGFAAGPDAGQVGNLCIVRLIFRQLLVTCAAHRGLDVGAQHLGTAPSLLR